MKKQNKPAGTDDIRSKKDDNRAAKKVVRRTSSEPRLTEGALSTESKGFVSREEKSFSNCVVVGIGASAGGLAVFREFLEALPGNTGMAFVLIQHLDPNHESMMFELLSRHTNMPVVTVEDAMPIRPDRVYIIPPNKFIKVRDGAFILDEPVKRRGIRMPIDYFFRSLADQLRNLAVGVVLSGTGSDGAQGMREIKSQGGMIMVQDLETAEYDGMPRSALATGLVDFELPIRKMPEALIQYVKHPYVYGASENFDDSKGHYESIINVLRAHADYDFRCYKRGTLSRRIQRRMGLGHMRKVEDYLKLLRSDRDEIKQLFKDLLISVTAFFRNSEAWSLLESDIIAKIVARKSNNGVIRIWVPGCATGEEAYSLGMVVYDEIASQRKNLSLLLFATDLDGDAIDRARLAVYPDSISADVPSARLSQYFTEMEDGQYRVNKRLRESMVFATQNVIADPPFSNLDLVSCRNLLIYLEQHIQKELFKLFHFALNKDGYLFLGASETIGRERKLFKELSKQWRIYQKIGASNLVSLRNPLPIPMDRRREVESVRMVGLQLSPVEYSKRLLLDRFAPACVVINRTFDIQYLHGPVRHYLDIPSGEPTHNLMSMCVEGLRSTVRRGVVRALHVGIAVEDVAPKVLRGDSTVSVLISIEVLPHESMKEGFLLITFQDTESVAFPGKVLKHSVTLNSDIESYQDPASAETLELVEENEAEKTRRHDPASAEAIRWQLEQDLQATREDLQGTIEEFETSNEELKASNEEIMSMNEELQSTNEELEASNEEVMSMNEELQSTNEELETSREELQSLNDELNTVNCELEDKVQQVEVANNDLSNLLSSTEIATLFLDTDFRIRRFTPAATKLLRVIETDIGRPVSDLASKFNDVDLYRDARKVLTDLSPIELEVFLSSDRLSAGAGGDDGEGSLDANSCFMRRILPYRTNENKIDGVVVTYTDITRLRNSLTQLEAREQQAAIVAEIGQAALSGKPIKQLIRHAMEALQTSLKSDFSKVLRVERNQGKLLLLEGIGWKRGLVGKERIDIGMKSQAGYTLQTSSPVLVDNLPKEKRFQGPKLLSSHGVVSGISVIIGKPEEPWGILATHSKRPGYYTVDDAYFLQSLANILWEAIERDSYEESLRHRLEEIDSVYETAPIGLCLLDKDLRYVRINEKLAEMNAKTVEEHIGRTVRSLFPEFADTLEPILETVLDQGKAVTDIEVEGRVNSKDDLRNHLASYYPLKIGSAIVGVNCVVKDITEQKRHRQEIVESERRLRVARDAAGLGIYDFNITEDIINIDERVGEFWGVDPSKPLTYEIFEKGVAPAECERLRREVRASLDPKKGGHIEVEYLYTNQKDGIVRWLLATGDVINDAEGRARMVGSLQDITERKRIEEDLRQADRRKDEFLAVLAHELRNPMAALSAGLEVMKMAYEDEAIMAETRSIMEKQVRQLTNLVNDLLDVARYTRNKLELRKTVAPLLEIVRDAVDAAYPQIQEGGHQLEVKLPRKPVYVSADTSRMCQVICNLLTNAAKFTREPGLIEISVKNVRGQRVAISVKDNGIGLSENDQEVIFDMFTQVGAGSASSTSGLGIGLTLVKGLVEKHDGTVEVKSLGEGQGATFVVTLPRTEEIPEVLVEQKKEKTAAGRRPLRVLVADDNEAALKTLSTVFTLKGHQTRSAVNGKEALRMAAQFKPDLVVLDLGMPELDGYQTVKEMKRRKWAKGTYFAALSGWGQTKDKERALVAGFDCHLVKPASIRELQEILSVAAERISQ